MYRKPFTLLDKLPTDYNGFALNTSWRVGVALTLLLDEQDLKNEAVLYTALRMLYKDIDTIDVQGNIKTLFKGIGWFLSCGESEILWVDKPTSSVNEKQISFREDAMDIRVWFKKGFNIDLDETKDIHWFMFTSMLYSAHDCPLATKLEYRSVDLSKFKDADTKKQYREAKSKLKVHMYLDPDLVNSKEIQDLVSKAKKGSFMAKHQLSQLNLDVLLTEGISV